MRLRLLPVAALAAVLLPAPSVAVPAPAPARAGASVDVAHLMFMPGKVKVALGESVTWTFPEASPHTTTSDQGFWDSGSRSNGETYVRTFTSAGRFAYHCSFHSTMRGSVSVGLRVDVPNEGTRVVRWATAKGAGGVGYDVQVKDGSAPWTDFRVDTLRPLGRIRAVTFADDVVKVRARTSSNGAESGWSRPVRLTFA